MLTLPMATTRRKEHRETSEYIGMLRRMIRGLGRRVAQGDPSDLADAIRLQAELDVVIREAVAVMRETTGFSYQQLADELGVSKQAAQQKYGRRAYLANRTTPSN